MSAPVRRIKQNHYTADQNLCFLYRFMLYGVETKTFIKHSQPRVMGEDHNGKEGVFGNWINGFWGGWWQRVSNRNLLLEQEQTELT